MAKRIQNNFIKELVSSADIVEVVSRFVNLKKAGKNYKACCPFHNEKTPSFTVNASKNFFHCFGCQESGDALTFVKKINNLEFIDAVKTLAEIVGKPIEYENYSKEDIQKDELYKKCISFLETAQKCYRWNLGNAPTKDKAIGYLKEREVDGALAKTFGIGYAPEGWTYVTDFANSIKIPQEILLESGLAIKNDSGRVYDRFRGRIMFPIRNIQGSVIAYGGRVIEDVEGVKYINSPETLVFQKNNVLYGLYEYRQLKKQQQVSESLVVVEGYMDVVGLAGFGFYGAVATLGTAFSQNHAKILFRETNSVVLCFDGDSAGQKAATRTIKIVLPILDANKKLKILSLADGKDPDDFIKSHGLSVFQEKVENAEPVAEFLVNSFIADKDLSKAESKAEVVESLKDFVSEVEANIYSESIIATISERIGLKVEQIQKLLKSRKKFVDVNDENHPNQPKIVQKKIAQNLLLEEKLLAEIFVNTQDVIEAIKSKDVEVFEGSKRLAILSKALKILKEDSSIDMQPVILIQLLCEEYPDFRDYFFELMSYGLEHSFKKNCESSYNHQLLSNLKVAESRSIRQRLKYLGTLPFRTEVQEMERKYLVAKMSN
ncbi:DNA primase [Francisella adeliensis]|uniref:DNA primase n=1 Tax=Francisella adeliensis TaxID=2007306 RepID=A0A2Z4XXA3_9GAMM|nr:DNA primase [Francisella adeliensis]AXA33511.1 DNA primase [Francisella adeliensis]MBK2084791.1 DNA primase [Francisella adeliensis]MBK2097266.1 DNA primase [Francisella adeliensis]QIW11742.1 DNA primase [Francisella adeliensis]QIW13616.1 DNA primase [Francisella adeliensis]